mmetsp:Transcript_9801/g.24450  ORF Transcript_9801/g.24450 Transcript_9801/m.24450 type:complete len:372 (-) Transcript_9801:270-1385(-)|eukprot:CAMPEP_0202868280 /NCGR_PEP_ID=MMETSP1391-20130828/10636_1 /ASSEMBLY_ACC=CAM_ASM_000867 /TAXON_ID=1034604 /ORGANISM="Chlamydomonas leiostraca, Strain SAG 11-49" /LENGTH=371 /DNA_ID=CAMNT_0049548425 /DNA_START=71 /DNA_END=1186 /DNA_ORIENTATION=+
MALANTAMRRPFTSGSVQRRDGCVARAVVVKERATLKGDTNYTFAPIINGCWQLAGGHGRDVLDDIQAKLAAHAEAGFTTFDTADIYGPSESILGDFAASWKASGKPPVQVFTKYVPNIFRQRVGPAEVESAIRRSLAALKTDTLDMVQLHWWDYNVPGMVDVALALGDLQAKGLIRHVATTNMDCEALAKIMDAGVPVAANQVQFSLLDRRPLNGMLQLAESRGVKLFTYGSVGGGLLSDRYVAEAKAGLFGGPRYPPVDLNTSSLKMYMNVAKQMGGGSTDLWRELLAVLKAVADKHSVSVANVALRWVMQQGNGNTVHPIVGLRSTAHIADNARVLSLQLDAQDLASIDAVLSKARGPVGDIYSFERS